MGWTWIDWSLSGIIALSTVISLIRGFTREVLSLITWILAIWVAIKFTVPAAEFLKEDITSPELRLIAAFAGLFIATLIAGSLVNYIISRLVTTTGLSGTDRLLGSIFGIARGLIVGVLLIVAAGFTPIVNQPAWKETKLIATFQPLTEWLLSFVPQEGTVAWLGGQVVNSHHEATKQEQNGAQTKPEQKSTTPTTDKSADKSTTVDPSATLTKKTTKSVFPDKPILEARD
jgi:membrane protein required for colicin V production